jgi:hypothetical protein
MKRLANLLSVIAATGVAASGCAPDVVIARDEGSNGGGSGGAVAVAGAGGSDASGSGAVPVGAAGGDGGAPVVTEPGRLLADSVADFGFVQGEHGWSYGYDGGSVDTFALLTQKSVITNYVPPTKDIWDCWTTEDMHWTQVFQLGGHPNGTISSPPSISVLERAVRRWTSTFAGDVVITGEIAKIDAAEMDSNGVDALVYVDGLQVYSTPIAGSDGGGLSYEIPTTLQVGSHVDFVLDPHEGNDHHDLTRFTAVIVRVEPAATP